MQNDRFDFCLIGDNNRNSSEVSNLVEETLKCIESLDHSSRFRLTHVTMSESPTKLLLHTSSCNSLLMGTSEDIHISPPSDSSIIYQRVTFLADIGPDIEIQVLSLPEQYAGDTVRLMKLGALAVDLAAKDDPTLPISIAVDGSTKTIEQHITETVRNAGWRCDEFDIKHIPVSQTLRNIFQCNECIIVGQLDEALLYELIRSTHGVIKTYAFFRDHSVDGLDTSRALLHIVKRNQETDSINLSEVLQTLCDILELSFGLRIVSQAVWQALRRTIDPVSRLGMNMLPRELGGCNPDRIVFQHFIKNLSFFLAVGSSSQLSNTSLRLRQNVPGEAVRQMNLIEKILTHSAVRLKSPEVAPGQMICVSVDWVLTSELLWGGMQKTYKRMKKPKLHRSDRIWLAVDHTVDPRTIHLPKQQRLMQDSEKFRDEAKIVHYLPANTSIMHTDFTREKAQPGKIVIGSDSHTCSAGSMGSFAVGFGAADVVMPMVTGETWLRVPEVCRIDFVGRLPYGVSGKDVTLHILGTFKRNTIAFQRAVEYGGPALGELSMDDRFAIANMTTEFGGMGACFQADGRTAQWIASRKNPRDRSGGAYFQPDPHAMYAERRTINLSIVQCTIGLYPDPDHVVPISMVAADMQLDGCFIGACTTAEEELILAALVLDAGLRKGLIPIKSGKRRVTPGSLVITETLDRAGLLRIYRRAGFEIGVPGCSYCVGINDVDVACEGEVWLSSQNRNFRNRMGKGSIGNIASAAVVATSSFNMRVTDPKPLLEAIHRETYDRLIGKGVRKTTRMPRFETPQPFFEGIDHDQNSPKIYFGIFPNHTLDKSGSATIFCSRIQRFGNNIDT